MSKLNEDLDDVERIADHYIEIGEADLLQDLSEYLKSKYLQGAMEGGDAEDWGDNAEQIMESLRNRASSPEGEEDEEEGGDG